MGIPYLEYVNRIRLEHIYTDLLYTDLPVGELQERHGFIIISCLCVCSGRFTAVRPVRYEAERRVRDNGCGSFGTM